MRTTIRIDLPLLAKIRQMSRREHKTFTRIVQELLALGLNAIAKRPPTSSPLRQWHSKKMGALIDYTDKEALYKVLDQRP